MTINISKDLEDKIVAFCDDELNYHINESGCADEYQDEIEAQIELLRLMGYTSMADDYEAQFAEYMDDNNYDHYRRNRGSGFIGEFDEDDNEYPDPDDDEYGLYEDE